MAVTKLSNLLNTNEVSSMVEGYMLFHSIDSSRYPCVGISLNDDFGPGASLPPIPQKPHRFSWSVYPINHAAHNTACIRQVDDLPSSISVVKRTYNDSLSDNPSSYPKEVREEKPIQRTQYFRQINGVDCGYCSFSFITHAIDYFENQYVQEKIPSIDSIPKPKYNPYDDQTPVFNGNSGTGRATARLTAAFYANCIAMHLSDEGMEQNIPSNQSNYKPMETGYILFEKFFDEKSKTEKNGLTKTEFLKFISEKIPRVTGVSFSSYEPWFSYQNIMLYLLLNNFNKVSVLIRNEPEKLSFHEIARLVSEMNLNGKPYWLKSQNKECYQLIARTLKLEEPQGSPVKETALPSDPNSNECSRFLLAINFDHRVRMIEQKANKYAREEQENYKNAVAAVGILCDALKLAKENFLNSKESMDTKNKIFTNVCLDAINESRKVLRHHRGWKQNLANFASAITSVFTLGIINTVTGRSLFGLFPTETDSTKKLNDFTEVLTKLKVNS